MDRQWTQEIMMEYPDKWVVAVNLEYDEQNHKYYGEVHSVLDSDIEAYAAKSKLGGSMGKTMVVEGHSSMPQIGGGLWS